MAHRMTHFGLILVTALAMVATLFVAVPPARGAQDVVVDDFPLIDEPRVMDGRIYAIDSHGDDVIVGGTFSTIRGSTQADPEILQKYLFKFNVSTGEIDPAFTPVLDGEVEGVAISADGNSVFIAGDFVTVNGETHQRIAKLSMVDGSLDPTFDARANNEVKDIALTDDALIVAGRFRYLNGTVRERIGALDPSTGALLTSFDVTVTDSRYEFAPYVQEIDVSPNEQWLLIGGNFQTVDGQHREQVAVLALSGTSASLANWSTERYVGDCASVYDDTYIRGLDISPDSSYFVINTTGAYRGVDTMCDTASRWELPPTQSGSGLQPTWTTHTGGDTHWAAHITDAAVYVGGHQRWENNPYPSPRGDNDGPGSVERYGIAALDPTSGVPLSWNPGRDRGRGVEALHSTDDHLFVGSDTVLFADQVRQRLAVLPTAGGTANPLPQDIELPTEVHVAIPGGDLIKARYDGVAFGTSSLVSGPGVDGIDWSDVRDGFVQHDQLSYFGSADAFYRRPYNGSTFGTPTNLSTSVGYIDENYDHTPYDQPYGVDTADAAAYAHGRIYYTSTDDTRLYWRWYSLESGIIGGQEYISSGGDFTGAVALDVMGDWLYAAWDDGNLYRMYMRDGGVVDYSTTQLAEDGSSGIDWSTATAIFSTQGSGSVPPIPPPGEVVCDAPGLPWRAEYFPTSFLGTAPVTVRCEAAIDYDWGTGSPAGTGVGPDDFSVRWTRDLVLDAEGALELTARSDDGVRIYVDDTLVMDEWRDQGATTFFATTGTLEAGTHEVVVEYYENGGGAVIEVDIAIGDPPLVCDTPELPWRAEYFDNETLSPVADTIRCEAAVDYDWGVGSPAGTAVGPDSFSARWTSTLDLEYPSTLDFDATSSDGIRVYVDGGIVIDEWRDQDTTTFSASTAEIPAGPHDVVVEYYEGFGDAAAQVDITINPNTGPDTIDPDGSVTVPVVDEVLPGPDVVLSGTATDNVGVTAVWIAIRNRSTGQWLQSDGVSFGTPYTLLPATLDTPGELSTDWTFPVTLADAGYAVQVKADDAAGNRDPSPPWVRFSVVTGTPDVTAPNGVVEVPILDEVLAGPDVELSGTASDDVGVSAVWVAIRDRSTGLWLQADGVSFAAPYTLLPATLDAPDEAITDWAFPVSLPDGVYAIQLKADDAAGNRDPSPPWVRFSVTSETPDIDDPDGVVDIPASGATLVGPDVVLSGSASDDVAVATVLVAIRNRSTGQWLQADGVSFGGSYTLLPATLDAPGTTNTGWTFPVTLADGLYAIQLKAEDAVGNRDPSPPWVPFTVAAS